MIMYSMMRLDSEEEKLDTLEDRPPAHMPGDHTLTFDHDVSKMNITITAHNRTRSQGHFEDSCDLEISEEKRIENSSRIAFRASV